MPQYLRAAAVAVALAFSGGSARGQSASLGYNFETANSTQSGYIPPDTNGAVGPNHVVIQNNGIYKMFDKAGLLANSQTADNFWTTRFRPPNSEMSRV